MNSTILDIFIGLVLIYSLFSMFASIIQEIIGNIINLRGRYLAKAIVEMLGKGQSGQKMLTVRKPAESDHFKGGHVSEFYEHPYIKVLWSGKKNGLIQNISKESFSSAICDLVDTKKLHHENGETDIEKYIKNVLNKGIEEKDHLKKELERWFDEKMNALSYRYKKFSAKILFFIGLSLAVVFNINTFDVVHLLATDKVVREQLVSMAETIEKDSLTTGETSEKYDKIYTEVNKTVSVMGAGWTAEAKTSFKNDIPMHLLGWLITALAISLGGPFWFDILKKAVRIKNSTK